MNRLVTFFALALITGGQAVAQEVGDLEAGQTKAGACVACHGPAGISVNPEWPNLAGQQETYLFNQLKAFRDGVRENPLMGPMVSGLSDQDLRDLAAYYHSLPAGGE